MDIKQLLVRLKILKRSAQDDYDKNFINPYNKYLAEVNYLLKEAKSIDNSISLEYLQDVPQGEKSIYSQKCTLAQKSKLREIILQTEQLESNFIARKSQNDESPLDKVNLICSKFHEIVKGMNNRYNDRPGLKITNEYDVQDLLKAVLVIFFEDIRPEENAPSFAGRSTRMDILLKDENIVIEVKLASKKLDGKKIAEELIQDIAHYKTHPHCKLLVCFIYDPEGEIRNKKGLIKDVESLGSTELCVQVIINPA